MSAANINRGAPATYTDGVLHASANLLTADDDGLVTSFATSDTAAVTKALGSFNGVLAVGGTTLAVPRVLSITGAGTGAFANPTTIVLTGRDFLGRPFSQGATLSSADGGTANWTIPVHVDLTTLSIAIPIQADDDGTWKIGMRASKVVDADWLLVKTAGTINGALVDALATPFDVVVVEATAVPLSMAVVHSITSAEFHAMRAAAR